MRLLNVICSTNPEHGGVIEWIRQLGPVAEALGHTVEVASMDSPDVPWVGNFPIKVHAMGNSLSNFYSPKLVPWLKAHARDYDAVIAHGLWRYPSFGTWRALRSSDTPYFVQTHGMLDPWFKYAYPIKHLMKSLYWPWTDYRALRDAKAVIFTCEQEKVKARQSFRLYKTRELVVPIGIAAPEGDPHEQIRLFYARYPETRNKRLLLFLGRIHPKKGCDLLIDAFSKVHRTTEDLHLVMAGPDQTEWVPKLKQLASARGLSDTITWTGMISGDIKWGAMRAADAFILPSHQENFGIAVVESMACGVPVLISDKVDIWKEIQQDNAGLIGSDTVIGTQAMLEQWLNLSDTERNAIRANALHSFHTRFEISHATRNFISQLKSMLSADGAIDKNEARSL